MEKSLISDSSLVILYTNGNEKAFQQLVQRHKSKIYTTIYLIVKDTYVAEDLLQDTFIKAMAEFVSPKPSGFFEMIASNRGL